MQIMKLRILFLLSFVLTVSAFAQKQQYVIVSVDGLLATNSNLKPGFGIGYEERLFEHHGYEFGLSYRCKQEDYYFDQGMNHWVVNVNESYLHLPILYKFYYNSLTISTGITFDCFLGGKYLNTIPNVTFGTYNIDPDLYAGWCFKIAKSINLSSKFILQPEIQYNPIFESGYSFYGLSMKLKYAL